MALTEHDVIELIKKYRLGLWERVKDSLPLLIVAGMLTLLFNEYLPHRIASKMAGVSSDVAVLKSDVGTLKSDITDIKKQILEQLTKALDSARQDAHKEIDRQDRRRGALEFGDRVLDMAQNLKVHIAQSDLAAYGAPIVRAAYHASSPDPVLHRAADTVLRYRSFLASQEAPDISKMKRVEIFDYYSADSVGLHRYKAGNRYLYYIGSGGVKGSDGKTGPVALLGFTLDGPPKDSAPLSQLPAVWGVGRVPISDSATVELIDPAEDFLKNRACSDLSVAYIIVQAKPGTKLFLDHLRFKNVIFLNSTVEYMGGATRLENVVFSDCSFDIKSSNTLGVQFAESLLAPGRTRFRS